MSKDFMPSLGIVSLYHLDGYFDVCSTNQLDDFKKRGWKLVTKTLKEHIEEIKEFQRNGKEKFFRENT
jgi:hypothetical protein